MWIKVCFPIGGHEYNNLWQLSSTNTYKYNSNEDMKLDIYKPMNGRVHRYTSLTVTKVILFSSLAHFFTVIPNLIYSVHEDTCLILRHMLSGSLVSNVCYSSITDNRVTQQLQSTYQNISLTLGFLREKKGLEIGFSLEDDLTRRYELLWAKLHIYRPVFT